MSRLAASCSALAFAALALTACTSSTTTAAAPASTAGAVFQLPANFQPNSAAQSCLLHQTDAPTGEFTGGPSASPGLQLPFMAYLRANGTKAFCDGKPATEIDKKWAALYVTLTGNAADVTGITK